MSDKLLWCWRGGQQTLNFGEWFGERILGGLGYGVRYWDVEARAGRIRPDESCLLMIGSELHRPLVDRLLRQVACLDVWGQGNGRGAEVAVDLSQTPYRERVRVCGLRGPLTYVRSGCRSEVPLCDPGFLLPRYWQLDVTGDGPVTYVPHHSNLERLSVAGVAASGAERIASPLVHRVELDAWAGRLAGARFVLTNTLHTWIFCLAYRVPCALCLVDGERLNMPDKWHDVLGSMGIRCAALPVVHDLDGGQRWWQNEGRHLAPPPDADTLLESFPRD